MQALEKYWASALIMPLRVLGPSTHYLHRSYTQLKPLYTFVDPGLYLGILSSVQLGGEELQGFKTDVFHTFIVI